MARRKAPRMKPFHDMTKQEAVERLRALDYSQPKADWDTLAVGNVILHKGNGWRITHIPPKRGFVMAANLMTGAVEKLLRSRYDTPELLVTDEATLAVLRTSHEEEVKKAVAAGLTICLEVQYDYPDVFTPYPVEWDEKRRERARNLWLRINEMRAYYDRQEPPGWQLRKVDHLVADAEEDIVRWRKYRAECKTRKKITKPEAIPKIVADVDTTLRDLKEQIETLRHLRKHLEKTVTTAKRE